MNETVRTILGILLIIVLILVLEKYREKKKLKRLRNIRMGLSKADYIMSLEKKGFLKLDIEVVYEKLKDFIAVEGFLLHPEDDIHKDYDITDLDDIELINQVCDNLGLPHPSDSEYDFANEKYEKMTASYILCLTKKIKEKNTVYNNGYT